MNGEVKAIPQLDGTTDVVLKRKNPEMEVPDLSIFANLSMEELLQVHIVTGERLKELGVSVSLQDSM